MKICNATIFTLSCFSDRNSYPIREEFWGNLLILYWRQVESNRKSKQKKIALESFKNWHSICGKNSDQKNRCSLAKNSYRNGGNTSHTDLWKFETTRVDQKIKYLSYLNPKGEVASCNIDGFMATYTSKPWAWQA